ncbi:hypothetical protein GGS24DRAFT_459062 [Hypoxylon argillaceum]|nr:hypothetical protein GGS24DRAFT_459062 [Hypoxylon argillaceum]
MIPRGRRMPIPLERVNGPKPQPERKPELKYTYDPTPNQCNVVKGILQKATNFPFEIIDIVMDLAEYWACSMASIDYSVTANQYLAIEGRHHEDALLLRTEPLGFTTWHSDDQGRWQAAAPARKLEEEYTKEELESFIEGPHVELKHPFRKIVFDIVSRDQGWGGEPNTNGSFRSSWTWFDVGVDRFDKGQIRSAEDIESSKSETSNSTEQALPTSAIRPVWPPLNESLSDYNHQLCPIADHMIQSNRVAERDWQHHHIEWSWTDDIDPNSREAEELEACGRGSATGDGRFLSSLKPGDMVTVWGHARFGGWVNKVQKVQVRVYWAL